MSMSGSSLLPTLSGESFGKRPSRGRGSNELRLHKIISVDRLSKLALVMPNTWVSPAPISPPRTLPPLEIDMSVAKSVASIPSGHNLAANTRTGMKEACARTVRIRESPIANHSSLIPSCLLKPVTRRTCKDIRLVTNIEETVLHLKRLTWVIPRPVPKTVVTRKIFLKGTVLRKPLYSPTPSNEAIEVTSLTLPRNSGVKPSLFVLRSQCLALASNLSNYYHLSGKRETYVK